MDMNVYTPLFLMIPLAVFSFSMAVYHTIKEKREERENKK